MVVHVRGPSHIVRRTRMKCNGHLPALTGADRLSCDGALRHVTVPDRDLGAAGHAALVHAARNDGSVRRHAAACGEDAFGTRHALDIFRRRLEAHENNFLSCLLRRERSLGGEDDRADGGARRRGEAARENGRLLLCHRVKHCVKNEFNLLRRNTHHSGPLIDETLL